MYSQQWNVSLTPKPNIKNVIKQKIGTSKAKLITNRKKKCYQNNYKAYLNVKCVDAEIPMIKNCSSLPCH
jgi:hypothetical protein